MNFLPDNRLHERPLGQDSDSDAFSPWHTVASDSEAQSSDVELVSKPASPELKQSRRRKSLEHAEAVRSSLTSVLRQVSPHRQTPQRPTFERQPTLKTAPSTSLLASALAQQGRWAQGTPGDDADMSQAASSTEEFSDLATEDESASVSPRTLTASLPMPMMARTPSRPSASMHGTSPRRRRGVRPLAGSSPSTLHTRRRSGVESEPEEGTGKADDTFLELLDATKQFMSFSNASVSRAPFANTATTARPVVQVQRAETDSSPDEVDIPTSLTSSGLLTDSQDERPAAQDKPALFAWFARLLEVKVWQALAVCSLVFSAGLGVGYGLTATRRLRFVL